MQYDPRHYQPVYTELFTAVYVEGGIAEQEGKRLLNLLIEKQFIPGNTFITPIRKGITQERDVVLLIGTRWSIVLQMFVRIFFPDRNVALLKQEYFKRNHSCFLKRKNGEWKEGDVKRCIDIMFRHSIHAEHCKKRDLFLVFVNKKTLEEVLREEKKKLTGIGELEVIEN
jgi:hypothetical protein